VIARIGGRFGAGTGKSAQVKWMRSWLLGWLMAVACALLCVHAAPAFAQQSGEEADEEIDYALLYVITNFDITSVEIDGQAYPPAWIYGENGGVHLHPGHDYHIVVSVTPEQRRTFDVNLRPGETRVLVVDIENIGAAPAALATAAAPTATASTEEEAPSEEIGHLGVSSSPRGTVYVDGSSTGQRTPARRIPLEPGRHEVTVFYDEEEQMSEVKHVLIRAGVNTNVFFRLRREQPPPEEE
jgi:hypothetical protein